MMLLPLLLLGAQFPAQVQAYIPPSQYLLRMIVARRVSYKNLRLKSTLTSLDPAAPGTAVKVVTVVDGASRSLRFRILDDQGKELYAGEKTLLPPSNFVKPLPTPVASPGIAQLPSPVPVPTVAPEAALSLGGSLLLEGHLEGLGKRLQEAGIPIRLEEELLALKDEEERRAAEKTSLVRQKTGLAWSVSAGTGAQDPQIWFEKDLFLPVRLVARSGDDVLEFRFESFRYVREFPFPRVITVSKAESLTPILKEELTDLTVSGDVPELKAPFVAGWTELGNQASPAVRELVRVYLQALR